MGEASWLMGEASWPMSEASWLMGEASWLMGEASWLMGEASSLMGEASWLMSEDSWLMSEAAWLMSEGSLPISDTASIYAIDHNSIGPVRPARAAIACLRLIGRLPVSAWLKSELRQLLVQRGRGARAGVEGIEIQLLVRRMDAIVR